MAEHYRFFDSANSLEPDRSYNAQEFTDYFKALVTTGVMKGTGEKLKVQTNGDTMISTVDTGIAFLLGRYYENDSVLELIHEIEAVGKNRIDRVVIRMDLSTDARNVKAFVKRGLAGTDPVAPTLTQTGNLYEISLAQVLIVGGQTFIEESSITDERGTDIICPWAGSNILPNFNDDGLDDLVNTVSRHTTSTNNPHNTDSAQVNVLPANSRKQADPYTMYPIGITTLEIDRARNPIHDWWWWNCVVTTIKGSDNPKGSTLQIISPADSVHQITYSRTVTEDGTWTSWKQFSGTPLYLNDDRYGEYWIDELNGDDNNPGTKAKPFKSAWMSSEYMKSLMLTDLTITIVGNHSEASTIMSNLADLRVGGRVEVDFGNNTLYWTNDFEFCGTELYLKNFILDDSRIQFKACAYARLFQVTFKLKNYNYYQDVVSVEGGTLEVAFCTFEQATSGTHMMTANAAGVLAAVGNKFVNCNTGSRAYTANNGVVMHNQNQITGTSPTMATKYGAGQVFTGV